MAGGSAIPGTKTVLGDGRQGQEIGNAGENEQKAARIDSESRQRQQVQVAGKGSS